MSATRSNRARPSVPGSATGKSSMSATVAERLRQAIVNADFDFGEALSEENLASAFNVSRTPVREALSMLQLEGLVSIVPKSGTYVFTPAPEDIVEMCEYRAGLELIAAELATGRDHAALADALGDLSRQMVEALEAGDIRRYGQLDTRYHLEFLEKSGNRYLMQGYRMIMGRVATLRTQLALNARNEPRRSMQDHQLMVELVRDRKIARLKTVLQAHVMRTTDNFVQAFQANDIRPLTQKEVVRRKLQKTRSLNDE